MALSATTLKDLLKTHFANYDFTNKTGEQIKADMFVVIANYMLSQPVGSVTLVPTAPPNTPILTTFTTVEFQSETSISGDVTMAKAHTAFASRFTNSLPSIMANSLPFTGCGVIDTKGAIDALSDVDKTSADKCLEALCEAYITWIKSLLMAGFTVTIV